MTENKEFRCRNCGRQSTEGDYRPYCGQHKEVARITTHTFFFYAFQSLTRLNKGLLYTLWQLVVCPWTVIRDYLNGHRVRYTAPLQTLIILCFISVIISPLFDHTNPTDIMDSLAVRTNPEAGKDIRWWILKTIDWYLSSPTFQYLTVFIPVVPPFMLFTCRRFKPRYNVGECMVAAVYTSCSIFTVSILTSPLDLATSYASPCICAAYLIVIGAIGISKALGYLHLSPVKKLLRIIGFFLLSLINYIIFYLSIAILIYLIFIRH